MGRTIEPLPLDETFDRGYEIEWLRDMPASDKVKLHGDGPGPILRVTPEGGESFIVIVPGLTGTMTLSTMPNPREFAVFNRRDTPVIVNVDHPENIIEIKHFLGHGVRNVFHLKNAEVVVMNSCCDLIAYGKLGLQWEHRSDLFCCDEPLIDVVDDHIVVDGQTHQSGGRRRVVIDGRSGKIID